MPIGTEQWRAGIASIKATLQVRACSNFSVGDFLFCSFYSFASLYLAIFLLIISAPFSVLATSLASTIHFCFHTEVFFALNVRELQSPLQNVIKLNSFFSRSDLFFIYMGFRDFMGKRQPTIALSCLSKASSHQVV